MVGELRTAIEQGDLVLHYQPKVRLVNGVLVGVEALVRWQHPERGLLPPGDFMPLAEPTALIKPLTQHVLDCALEQCRRWEDAGRVLAVAVNISARNLLDAGFADMNMSTDATDAMIVRSTIELGHNLGLQVVAEGIETQAVHDALRELGCDVGQGFHIGRPLPSAGFEEWMDCEDDEGRPSPDPLLAV